LPGDLRVKNFNKHSFSNITLLKVFSPLDNPGLDENLKKVKNIFDREKNSYRFD
jgi:hypothetical protein